MKDIKLYFDFLSPFSYFTWKTHKTQFKDKGVKISYHPVLMGKLFSHHEFPGPGQIPAKRKYELKKCFRYAHKNNIKFNPPNSFPFNPLAIIRMATTHAAREKQELVIENIFDLVWGEGKILEDPDYIIGLWNERQLDTQIIERSFDRQAKLELKDNIKNAISLDIFGVPSFVIDDEYFWGNDSIPDLINYIDNNDKWNKELYNELLK